MAFVNELISGLDGKTRAAVVRIVEKAGKITRVRRPLQKLYPIELQSEKSNDICGRSQAREHLKHLTVIN